MPPVTPNAVQNVLIRACQRGGLTLPPSIWHGGRLPAQFLLLHTAISAVFSSKSPVSQLIGTCLHLISFLPLGVISLISHVDYSAEACRRTPAVMCPLCATGNVTATASEQSKHETQLLV